ncbi:MAG: right-handed parallel beta-helix repeat-containing protein [Acidimicrobiales bacterium]
MPGRPPLVARTLGVATVLVQLVVVLVVVVLGAPSAHASGGAGEIVGAGVPAVVPPPEAGSQLVDCSQAGAPVVVTVSSHLDPSCTYTGGLRIAASDVVLDCQGALVQSASGAGGVGIVVSTPADTSMSGDVVRNCRVSGFLNSMRVTRTGFRSLARGHEFDHTLSDVVIEHSEVSGSHGVGIFVDGYVDDVTVAEVSVTHAGSSGIYLEAGSRHNTVTGNVIHDNGFTENAGDGQLATFGGLQFRFWGIGREGLSIDGSSDNTVSGNSFAGNSAGGIFLYTNCGEHKDQPDWFERRSGAERNLIEANTFDGGITGVWVGSRMGENTLPMDCSDTPYVTGPLLSIALDRAADTTVRGNAFHDVTYGVHVEDDGAQVIGNTFSGPSGAYHAIIVGTRVRTTALAHPVTRTVVTGNVSTIVGNPDPFRWVHGVSDINVTGNRALGRPVGICPGQELPHLQFIFVLAVAYEPPGSPVTPRPPGLTMPLLGQLPACAPSATPRVLPGVGTVVEGDAGPTTMLVPVTLSVPSDQTVTADWSTLAVPGADGDQADGSTDYVPASGTVTFQPGQTTATVSVVVTGDGLVEPDEYVVVSFRRPTNATMGGFWGLGFGVITDDDA